MPLETNISSFDLNEQVCKAKLADQAGRYDHVIEAIKSIAEAGIEVSNEVRNLFSIACKNLVEPMRKSCRVVSEVNKKVHCNICESRIVMDYRRRILEEFETHCYDMIKLIDKFLTQKVTNEEDKIFYLKLKGDYYRYLAEFAGEVGCERMETLWNSQDSYEFAYNLSKTILKPTHPIRISVVINLSKCLNDTYPSSYDQLPLLEQALKEADDELENTPIEGLDEESKRMLQVLRGAMASETSTSTANIDDQLYKAKLAEQAGRYDHVIEALKYIGEAGIGLSYEAKNLFSISCKKVVEPMRKSCRVVFDKIHQDTMERRIIADYWWKIHDEFETHCYDIIKLIDKFLAQKVTNEEDKIFYLKLKGDHYRYLAEFADEIGCERMEVVYNSEDSYKMAYNLAKSILKPTHPMRLSVVVNFSTYFHETFNSPQDALSLIEQALIDADNELEKTDPIEELDEESTRMLQVLRDTAKSYQENTRR